MLQFRPFFLKAVIGHLLTILNPVFLNFELFYCSATLSKSKSIGIDDFLKWQNGANQYFPGFIALEVV